MSEKEQYTELLGQSPELNENIAETTKWVVRLTFMSELGLHRNQPTPNRHYPDMGIATYFEAIPKLSGGTELTPTYNEQETAPTLMWQGWEKVCIAAISPPPLPAQDPAIANAHWYYFGLGQRHGAITPEGFLNPQFKMALDIMNQKIHPQHEVILPILKTAYEVNQWANIPKQDFPEHIADIVSHESFTDFNEYLAAQFTKLDSLTNTWLSAPPTARPFPITYVPIPFKED